MKKMQVIKKAEISGHMAGIFCLCPGQAENTFFSGSADKYVVLWNLKTGAQEKFAAKMNAAVYSLHYLRHLNQLWIGTGSGTIHVIDITEKKEIHAFRYHKGAVFKILFNPNTGLIYSSGADGHFFTYDPAQLKNIHGLQLSDKKIRTFAFTKNQILLGEANGKTLVLNLQNQELMHEFKSHEGATNCFYIDRSENMLYSGGRDAHLRCWDIKNNFNLIKEIPAHNFAVYDIITNDAAELAFTCSRDKTIKMWDLEKFSFMERYSLDKGAGHSHSVNCLLWNESEKTLISGGDDRKVILWKLEEINA